MIKLVGFVLYDTCPVTDLLSRSTYPQSCLPSTMNIRLARVEDMPGMQGCNLHNLPENYTMKYCAR